MAAGAGNLFGSGPTHIQSIGIADDHPGLVLHCDCDPSRSVFRKGDIHGNQVLDSLAVNGQRCFGLTVVGLGLVTIEAVIPFRHPYATILVDLNRRYAPAIRPDTSEADFIN